MPEDELAISTIVSQAYDALAFAPGSEPDWAQFDACFHARAVLALRVFPTDPAVSVLDLREYSHSQMRNSLGDEGYSETPGDQDIRVVGDIAVVHQHFTMNFRAGVVPALDIFSLARTPAGWRIVSVISDVGAPDR